MRRARRVDGQRALCSLEQRPLRTSATMEPIAMVKRPVEINAFEFAVLSSLRAAQLMRGCTPRVASTQKMIMTAQLEVAAGKVARLVPPLPDV